MSGKGAWTGLCRLRQGPCRHQVSCQGLLRLTTQPCPQIASELDRSPGEVLKKLEDVRNRII